MAKPGRNDRCPCGSGKKYKACCLTRDEAAEREELAKAQAGRDERAAEKRQSLREVREAMLAKLSGSEEPEDDLDAASNAVLTLIGAGKLDEAEAAARDLLARFPDEHDGWDRLGMAHQARGENSQAAECYRNVLDVVRRRAGDYEPAFEQKFITLIDRLDPPSATS